MTNYNGIELPDLPEWDKEKYPYAVLQWCAHRFGYNDGDVLDPHYARLIVSDQQLFAAVGSVNTVLCAKNPVEYMEAYTVTADNLGQFGADVWAGFENKNVDTTSDIAEIGIGVYQVNYIDCLIKSFITYRYLYNVIWANHDIYKTDGTIYFSIGNPEEPEQPETDLTNIDLYRKINGKPTKLTLYKKLGGKLVPLDEHTKEVKT